MPFLLLLVLRHGPSSRMPLMSVIIPTHRGKLKETPKMNNKKIAVAGRFAPFVGHSWRLKIAGRIKRCRLICEIRKVWFFLNKPNGMVKHLTYIFIGKGKGTLEQAKTKTPKRRAVTTTVSLNCRTRQGVRRNLSFDNDNAAAASSNRKSPRKKQASPAKNGNQTPKKTAKRRRYTSSSSKSSMIHRSALHTYSSGCRNSK